jgi:hypothetical protein
MFEYGPDESQSDEQYFKIKTFIEDYDKVLIDTLMIDRETKFNNLFQAEILSNPDQKSTEEIMNKDIEMTEKKVKQAKKALEDYDSDDERENATVMFINDL